MKLTKCFILFILLSISFNLYSQNTDIVKKNGHEESYSRSSFSYILLDFSNENYSDMLRNAINNAQVPSKFDHNNLNEKIINSPYQHTSVISYGNKNNTKSVTNSIISNNYALKLIKYWWNIDQQGNYSTDLVKKRGFYNATDIEVDKADAEKRGRNAIADAGAKLIANSYILVVDYHDIKTMKEIYDKQDADRKKAAEKNKTEFKPVKRVKNGYMGKLTSYLLRLNYNDTIDGYFYQSFYENENRIDNKKLNDIYNNISTPFKFMTVTNTEADGTQYNKGQILAPAIQKSKQQLIDKLVSDGIEKALSQIEKDFEQFRVKTPVFSVHPIKAKVGKKEGLTQDRRYFIWSYAQNSKGNTIAQKKGVVRAKKITDNRKDELGNTSTSTFYQVAGHKIDVGMTMQEKKDFGLDLSFGYAPLDMGGFVFRGGINVGQFLNFPMSQVKIYGDFAFQAKEYPTANFTDIGITIDSDPKKFNFSRFAVGIQKEFYFARNFHFSVFGGIAGETVSNWDTEVDGEELSTTMINFGARFGINVTHNVQLETTAGTYSFYGKAKYKENSDAKDGVEIDYTWDEIFIDRSPAYFDISLRILF
ncbi:MAG: hypothetical protein JXR51_11760 [Bacteroidales bacterium]|nr:hypothetical protein [Bacteroidales bacterium]MBN2757846.1 hypothetical protein [Bacteroidales bacterium]